MDKENVSYEIFIDVIAKMVKRYIDNIQATKEDDDKCLNVG
ncbi:hypothetical protein CSC2_13040 [Clostridium zeae]|uniref:Uncharacterized protein n=1 Tax=Clostridium zeae TaxID=2759022 RepID=A0ABQ1E7Q9_9CLOT|nr:hypothetical protein [Clostridium zeae]GFZ30778.1 hypothetical protein CSC2_13040 [Clostridium zeae]